MKINIKISHKILFALIIPVLLAVLLMVFLMQWSLRSGFRNYAAKSEIEKLDDFVSAVSLVYEKRGGFDDLRNRDNRWMHVLFAAEAISLGMDAPEGFPEFWEFEKVETILFQPKIMMKHRPGVKMSRPPMVSGTFSGDNRFVPDQVPHVYEEKPKSDFNGFPPPPSRFDFEKMKKFDSFRIIPRLSLYDNQKKIIVGKKQKESVFKEVSYKGELVGYLGLEPSNRLTKEDDIIFLNTQYISLAIIFGVILLFSIIIAAVISRHIVRPFDIFTHSIRALASGDFASRVDINSKDELELLANDINHLAHTLEKNEKSRRYWVAGISHELRTPISILRGEIEAIQDKVRTASDETMNSLYSEVLSLNRIVEDLYILSLSDVGELQYQMEPIEPLSILNGLVETYKDRFKKSGIVLDCKFPKNFEIKVYGDQLRIGQLYKNIIENTLKYTASPGKLLITSDIVDDQLEIVFSDSAPSVPESSMSKIFDKFYRENSVSNPTCNRGNGLGLAICKNIIEAHNGDINASFSALGGLRIRIIIKTIKV